MCGIVGAAGLLTAKHENVFKTLLKLDTLRGKHSTGVASVGPKGDVIVRKVVGTPWEFDDSKSCQDVFIGQRNVLIGHNRYATKGAVNKVNAHPFEFETVVGVHNGTLRNQYDLPNNRQFEVDSENAFHAMDELGEINTLEKIDGAYAFVWWNKDDNILRMARNSERPMFYCYTEDSKAMFFASEAWMLHVATSRENVKIAEVHEVHTCEVYDFEIPLQHSSGRELLPNPTAVKFKEYKRPVSTHVTTYNRGTTSVSVSSKSNVSNINNRKVETTESKKINEDQPLLDEVVEFSITGTVTYGRTSYVKGELSEYDTDNECRIYAPYQGKLWKTMENDDSGFFCGKIKKVKKEGNKTIWVINIGSVTASDSCYKDEDEGEDYDEKYEVVSRTSFPVYSGTGNAHVWEQETKNGCSMCGDAADVREAGEYIWLGPRNYICGECKETEFAKEYMAQ